jgi:hypothetical protein
MEKFFEIVIGMIVYPISLALGIIGGFLIGPGFIIFLIWLINRTTTL